MYIKRTTHFLPNTVLTNFLFESSLDTSDEWIQKRTGIKERRTAVVEDPQRPMRYMAEAAVTRLALTTREKEGIKHIIFASGMAEENYPNIANYLAKTFDIKAPGIRINSACSSFISGLKFSNSLIAEGDVLLVSSESFTSIADYSDKTSCILAGDGACAYLLSKDKGDYHIGDIELSGFGSDLINTGYPGQSPETTVLDFCKKHIPLSTKPLDNDHRPLPSYGRFSQNGKEVYKTILTDIPPLLSEKIERLSLKKKELYFIGHQANLRMLEKIVEKIGTQKSRHLHNVTKYGNTASVGCGIVLSEAIEDQLFQPGSKVLLSAFGAGVVYGSSVITKVL